jgi:hypothetical protein
MLYVCKLSSNCSLFTNETRPFYQHYFFALEVGLCLTNAVPVVLMQLVAPAALTVVLALHVHAQMLAPSIVLRAFILVCNHNDGG